ncbi:MAG: hypothetical protein HC922_01890 [Leptolyngbyaceae cyanobacterium SM2_3_12]|nr:hypothetical protein [Leptolyngbyaceae cyanobacterium SM2_3_12]
MRATDIMPIVESFLKQPLPVQFPTGLVSGNVDFVIDPDQPFSMQGMARVSEGTVVTRGLPEPLQELQGDVRFEHRTIQFEDVTARLGELTAEASGPLDLDQGYDFKGQINPFTVTQLSDLFEFDLPVATAGIFGADVTMTGPLNQPVIASQLQAQGPVVIDQVTFSELEAKATLKAPNLVIDSFQAIPQGGGAIAAAAFIPLVNQPSSP